MAEAAERTQAVGCRRLRRRIAQRPVVGVLGTPVPADLATATGTSESPAARATVLAVGVVAPAESALTVCLAFRAPFHERPDALARRGRGGPTHPAVGRCGARDDGRTGGDACVRLSDDAMAELTALTADERTAVMRALEAGDRDADEAGAPAPDLPVARPIAHWQNEPAPTAVIWRDLGEANPSGNSDEAKDAICSAGRGRSQCRSGLRNRVWVADQTRPGRAPVLRGPAAANVASLPLRRRCRQLPHS